VKTAESSYLQAFFEYDGHEINVITRHKSNGNLQNKIREKQPFWHKNVPFRKNRKWTV